MNHNTTKQKTLLITGANNPEGIGAAIAKLFHNSGFMEVIFISWPPHSLDLYRN